MKSVAVRSRRGGFAAEVYRQVCKSEESVCVCVFVCIIAFRIFTLRDYFRSRFFFLKLNRDNLLKENLFFNEF